MAYLVFMDGPEKGKRIDLPSEGEAVIGRNTDNAVVVEGPAVSGRHCSITIREGQFVLRDLGSTNGTRVNDVPASEVVLFRGDMLTLGTTMLMLEGEDAPARSDDPALGGGIEAPRVEIRARTTSSRTPVKRPRDFGKRRDTNRRWKVIIILVSLLVLAALVLFVREALLSTPPETTLPPMDPLGEPAAETEPQSPDV